LDFLIKFFLFFTNLISINFLFLNSAKLTGLVGFYKQFVFLERKKLNENQFDLFHPPAHLNPKLKQQQRSNNNKDPSNQTVQSSNLALNINLFNPNPITKTQKETQFELVNIYLKLQTSNKNKRYAMTRNKN
jgi:hypothetical protein